MIIIRLFVQPYRNIDAIGGFSFWQAAMTAISLSHAADKQLFYQDANESDAFIAEKVHYVSTKGRAQFGQTILIIKSHQYSYKVAQTI